MRNSERIRPTRPELKQQVAMGLPGVGRRWKEGKLTDFSLGVTVRRARKFLTVEEIAELSGLEPSTVEAATSY